MYSSKDLQSQSWFMEIIKLLKVCTTWSRNTEETKWNNHKYMEIKQHTLKQPTDQMRNHKGNWKIF